jgi:hypothetical protein
VFHAFASLIKKLLTHKKFKNESNSNLSTFTQIVGGALAC